MGERRRYRVVDLERLCWRLQAGSLEEIRQNLATSLTERIARAELAREARWTERLAVGSRGFVERVQPLIFARRETEIVASTGNDVWALQEAAVPYGQEPGLKKAARFGERGSECEENKGGFRN